MAAALEGSEIIRPRTLGKERNTKLSEQPRQWRLRPIHGFKLDERDVIAIRQRLAGGARAKDLAREYHVHAGHISRIKDRKQWKQP